jgi:nucleotide-binding universal stress UspA family protein
MAILALCVDGVRDELLVEAALPWTGHFARVEVWCAYGDAAARELEHLRERHGRPHHPPPHQPPPRHRPSSPPRHPEPDPDREQAEAIAARAAGLLAARRVAANPRVLGGRDAGHAIAAASTPDIALFLAAGHRGGIGPKSIGHVARFVIDHAIGPVIVVRP